MINLLLVLICGILWRLGGWDKAKWSGYRDTLIPNLLAIHTIVKYNWWLGILVCGTYQIIRIGYGEDSLLYKWFGVHVARGMAGVTYSLIGALPIVLYTHNYLFYFIYTGINFTIGYWLDGMGVKDIIIEPVIGAGVGSILLI